jgi:hypothetical protein
VKAIPTVRRDTLFTTSTLSPPKKTTSTDKVKSKFTINAKRKAQDRKSQKKKQKKPGQKSIKQEKRHNVHPHHRPLAPLLPPTLHQYRALL